jgi:8-oxo-dGTP pyrophosphatase MutT (NUDIX family)
MQTQRRTIQTFEVSLKAALFSNGRLLLLQEADTGYWELPGGRIDAGEEWRAHDAVLARELNEELGPDVQFALTDRAVSFVRQRPTDGVYQFVQVRLCHYHGGELRLSEEHRAHAWHDAAGAQSLRYPPLSDYPAAIAKLFAIGV